MPEGSGNEEAPTIRVRLARRPLLVSLVYLVGYLALDVATEGLKGSLEVSLWFPPVGLTFALLLVFGWRYAPAVGLVFLLHLILFRNGLSYPLAILFTIPVCYAALYAGGTALLVRVLKIDPRLAGLRDVAWFVVVACLLVPFVGSAVVVSGMVLAGYVPPTAFWGNLLGFWAGDATGIAVLASFLLVALRPFDSLWIQRPGEEPATRTSFRLPSRPELPEAGLQVLVLALAAAYGGGRDTSLDYAYLTFAPLVWIALRGGFERATVAALAINVSVVVLVGGSVEGADPTLLQFGLMALTLVGLLLGGQTTERERTEEALRKSEQRFRSVVHNSSEAITILDPDGTVRYTSPAFERLFGYAPEAFVGENINDYIHPEDLPRVARVSEKALVQNGVARNVAEHRLRHKDGTWRYVETTGTYLLEDPAVRGVVVNARDISRRKEAEEALKESEERFRQLAENIREVFWMISAAEQRLLYVSPAFEEVWGRSPEVLFLDPEAFLATIHPDDRTRVSRGREVRHRGEFEDEYRIVRPDGEVRWIRDRGFPVWGAGGEIDRMVGIAEDITAHKQAREALEESEERFRGAFEDAPIGVALVSPEMRYLRVNQALCEMLGYSEEALLQKTSPEIIHPDDHAISAEYARQALEEGLESYTLERRYVRPDGRVAWNLTSASLIRNSEGVPSHFVCLHQDITERKALEERLEHQAFHDALTGLPNRALLLDRLDQALARTERRGRGIALLFLDLDDFKVVNDSLGHEAGDELLVEAARRLKKLARSEDTIARLAGDEFCVLLEDADAKEAVRVAGRILAEIKDAPFLLGGAEGEQRKPVSVTASIGVALSRFPNHRPSDLIKEADIAMYQAKAEGKGRHAVFAPLPPEKPGEHEP